MRVAQLFRRTFRMEWIGEQQEPVGGETLSGEHRGGTSTKRATPDQELARRKLRAHLFLGYDSTGAGISFDRSVRGRRLKATIPASKMNDPRIGKAYTLKLQAVRKGGRSLLRSVSFELCL
jgi:hypothetical protein